MAQAALNKCSLPPKKSNPCNSLNPPHTSTIQSYRWCLVPSPYSTITNDFATVSGPFYALLHNFSAFLRFLDYAPGLPRLQKAHSRCWEVAHLPHRGQYLHLQ